MVLNDNFSKKGTENTDHSKQVIKFLGFHIMLLGKIVSLAYI
jgi:hypothetical protein